MGYSDALFSHPLPRQPGLEQPCLCDGRVLGEVHWAALPLRDLFGHVEVATVIGAVRVKGELNPLLAEGYIHPLCMPEDEEPARAGRGEGRGDILLHCTTVGQVVGGGRVLWLLLDLVHPGIELLHVPPLREQPSRVVVQLHVLAPQEWVFTSNGWET